jgi:predicted ATPase
MSYFPALLAEAHESTGNSAEALRLLDGALAFAARTGERWYEAELHRHKGEVVLRTTASPGEAETCFARALAVAREQGARMWELRAATSLAGLWRNQDKRTEARDLLASIYGGFNEGFDTPDLKDARTLLAELK